ncbi:MAG: hypothetical protein LQ352_000001 [Teloschistes flavicans]|nr:MAG: hypothetical protein LQ352_000001 [Teloschistes flavicans]
MAESITEGTLKQWSKHIVLISDPLPWVEIGDFVEQDEEIATIETDKIDVAVNAPEAGTVREYLAQEEDTVIVGQDIVKLELGEPPKGGEKQQASQEPKAPAPAKQPTASDPEPSKNENCQQQNKSQSQSQPLSAEQEQPHAKQQSSPAPSKKDSPQESPTRQAQKQATKPSESKKPSLKSSDSQSPDPSTPYGGRGERRVKMNRMRLRIAERLKQSQNTAASLTTFNEVDMSSIMQFRKLYKEDVLKKTGVKLGFMSAFSRACILAMREVPAVNASIEGPDGGDTIIYRDYVDISVAVATEKGLVTPVVRNAEKMDLVGIEKAIADLGKKARDNKLTIEDMAGGSFTISNVSEGYTIASNGT